MSHHRLNLAAVTAAALLVAIPATAQTQTGNRANGRDYQPRPGDVVPQEQAAGIAPPASRQKSQDQQLEQLDKQLLRGEGQNPATAPKIAPR